MYRIEELILIGLILLNLLEFAGVLGGDFGYVKKVISYTILGVLLFKSSLSKVFFGSKNQNFDFLIVFAYFLLAFKNVFIVSISSIEKSVYFKPFFYLLTINGPLFEIITFYLAIVLLLGIAIWSGIKFKIEKPSMFSVLHEKNKERRIQKIVTNYFVFLAFFLFVFNLAFEWLAISIDSPIISIAFFAYVFLAIRKHHLDTESVLFKIGNYGESFYENFINQFKYKEKFILGIVGMLILHMLTDVGVFILPYILGLQNELYLPLFETGHETLYNLVLGLNLSLGSTIALFIQYFISAVGYLLLMIIPMIIWRNLYFRKQLHVNPWILAGFFGGLFAFMITPIFKLEILRSEFFTGVDVLTKPVFVNPLLALLLSIVAIFISYVLAKKYHKLLSHIANLFSSLFFLYYIILYFLSVVNWYRIASFSLLQTPNWILGLHFFFFLMLAIIFYIGGYYFYVRSLIKHKVTI